MKTLKLKTVVAAVGLIAFVAGTMGTVRAEEINTNNSQVSNSETIGCVNLRNTLTGLFLPEFLTMQEIKPKTDKLSANIVADVIQLIRSGELNLKNLHPFETTGRNRIRDLIRKYSEPYCTEDNDKRTSSFNDGVTYSFAGFYCLDNDDSVFSESEITAYMSYQIPNINNRKSSIFEYPICREDSCLDISVNYGPFLLKTIINAKTGEVVAIKRWVRCSLYNRDLISKKNTSYFPTGFTSIGQETLDAWIDLQLEHLSRKECIKSNFSPASINGNQSPGEQPGVTGGGSGESLITRPTGVTVQQGI